MTAKTDRPIESTADREIVITRTFDAPRELVWQAMTDPARVVKWWGPNGFTTTIEQMDARPGGVWKHVMHGPDGTTYPNKSIFKEVVKPERLVFSHAGGKEDKADPGANFVATWSFDKDGDKTRVTIRMVFPTAEARDHVVKVYGAIEGGKQTLARLAEQLAKEPVVVERTFKAPIALVWKAITDLEQMKQWYFTDLTAFKPEVGFETQVNVSHAGKNHLHLWKVTEVVAGKKITYRWKYADAVGESFVTFELFSEGAQTRLVLTHRGLETFLPETNPGYARGNFVMGWTHFGSALKEFVEDLAPFADRTFVISRKFNAPCELVWQAWTDPKRLARWWGPQQFTNPVCDLDLRVGGAYHIVMRAPDGAEYPITGVFREIVPNERLVMSMDCSGHPDSWHDQINPHRDKTKKPTLELVQTVIFESIGDKTKLTIRTRMETPAIRDAMVKMGMYEGWSQSLDRLTNEVEK